MIPAAPSRRAFLRCLPAAPLALLPAAAPPEDDVDLRNYVGLPSLSGATVSIVGKLSSAPLPPPSKVRA